MGCGGDAGGVSIHAPLTGSDVSTVATERGFYVSIHAPLTIMDPRIWTVKRAGIKS